VKKKGKGALGLVLKSTKKKGRRGTEKNVVTPIAALAGGRESDP